MKAVHFGAGNIGRGFIGVLLHEAGYDLVFADVNGELTERIDRVGHFTVHEVGEGGTDHVVDNVRAIDSRSHEDELVAEIASADIVTTAVGPNILRFVAPAIARGIDQRPEDAAPLAVMACENAVNATDILQAEVRAAVGDAAWEKLAAKAVFANTAVDRIVPAQEPTGPDGIDVTVETFSEWAIEEPPFGGNAPRIPGAHFVPDLEPYIERKLFTVNTGHATTAYFGALAGHDAIADAIGDPDVAAKVRATLEETSALLVEKHGLDVSEQDAYRATILQRFANPHLPDTVSRVGRQPLRKLSRNERFVSPAAQLAERGTDPVALVAAIGAALRFDAADDEQSVLMKTALSTLTTEQFIDEHLGLEPEHPLYASLFDVVAARAQEL